MTDLRISKRTGLIEDEVGLGKVVMEGYFLDVYELGRLIRREYVGGVTAVVKKSDKKMLNLNINI